MNRLRLEHVCKHFGEKLAVDDMSLELAEGEIYGLLGANGAGKTTTMRMALGLILPDEGRIEWQGQPYSAKMIARKMGYLPEERGLYPKVKICDQIIYLARLRGISHAQADRDLREWLGKFGIEDYYGKRVEELSKGNQQKIQFIASVIHRPDIVIMDEAFSGLDPVNVELLKKTVLELRNQGVSILFSTHRMEHVEELCERICIMHRSKTVLKGKLQEIKAKFPREKVILETEDEVTGLENVAGIVGVKRNAAYTEIRIDHLEAAQHILHLAAEQTAVRRFQLMEPTLNDIFIRTVGDRHE
ncbi:MAG: transporter related [Paenibacillaceae bacterium]|jgi:ABC-2 type transport system ATP-binding protein|nr:transporter related [Paenibacillaceae bacterium]